MGTEFGTLTAALSALQSERKALEVTGQNIANANTAGYTRQRAVFTAVGGSVVPAMYSKSDGIGSGVQISDVQRLQDAFLEQRANSENGKLSNLQGVQDTMSNIENLFGEPGDAGLQALLSSYWNGWDDVANNPSDASARTALIGTAQSLASGLNTASASLSAQWQSSLESLQSTVQQINTSAANIASLNKAIVAATAAGNAPNDLKDQRDLLIRNLASNIGVSTRVNADGSTDVLLGGSALVSGSYARSLAVAGATAIDQATTTPVAVTWTDTGMTAAATAGKTGAWLSSLNTILPTYSQSLDDVAGQLVSSVNAQQAAGYDLNGNPGGPFFDPAKTTAGSITVSLTDPDLVAASAVAPSGTPPQPSFDGSNAQKMADMSGTGADDLYRQMIVKLGSASQSAQQQVTTQTSVVNQIEQARNSTAGVDLDEEQTNLIAYQQAYNAAARFLSVLDGILDTLINKTLV